jgi:tetratricopeptide (TPR) repeat protein
MGELRLEVKAYQHQAQWDWELSGPGGEVLAGHRVRLDPRRWELEAVSQLPAYLRSHAAPDKRLADETRIVDEMGDWIGEQVLGPIAREMIEMRPATVRVIIPHEAAALLGWPLQVARVNGVPLALQDVTFVIEQSDGEAGGKTTASRSQPEATTAVGERLRVLGLFSLPTGERALNLRQERVALVQLFSQMASLGASVDVRVLQYGVTRARLADVLSEQEGWDIVHISGHGAPGELLLETDDGEPDPVAGAELAALLRPALGRLKLVTVSACWSAAAARRQILQMPARTQQEDARVEQEPDARHAQALAVHLAELGCAVLAMRYSVADDFAIDLAGTLYRELTLGQQPLPQALAIALKASAAVPPTLARPPLSAGSPALFGAAAARIRLDLPEHQGPQPGKTLKPGFEGLDPPEWFVGRTKVMAAASAALAPRSGIPGILLHGVPGAGKTACARELSFTHQHAFTRLVWFTVAGLEASAAIALIRFARDLEEALPGLGLADLLGDSEQLVAALQELARQIEQNRVLVVLDHLDPLLTADGRWRDGRWGQVITALCAHTGDGRVVLTSRRRPAGLDSAIRAEAVAALSADEAVLLAHQLPGLARLIDGKIPGTGASAGRMLIRRILAISQGHPMLLELAARQAARLEGLKDLLDTGVQAWQEAGGSLEAFFTDGESHAGQDDYLRVLSSWTQTACDALPAEARVLFWLLCCLEERDRTAHIGSLVLPFVRGEQHRDTRPDIRETLESLTAAGLITAPPQPAGPQSRYQIQSVVASAGRFQAGDQFRHQVDARLADYLSTLALFARQREVAGGGWITVDASLRAVPYLLRRGRWLIAAGLIEGVLRRDRSRAATTVALSALTEINRASAGTPDQAAVAGTLARALESLDPAAAERQARVALDQALARQDYHAASVGASDVCWHCRRIGRLTEALRFAEQELEYAQRAGFDPWALLGAGSSRLAVLADMGRHELVLAEVCRLREHMDALERASVPARMAPSWTVREPIIASGSHAARDLGRWDLALALSAEIAASMRARSASDFYLTAARFADYFPLLRLGLIDEAEDLLTWCREVAERSRDLDGLSGAFSALADVENERQHYDIAIGLERTALRYRYQLMDIPGIALSYHQLGTHLGHQGNPAAALPYCLAAGLIRLIVGLANLEDSVNNAATALSNHSDQQAVLADITELCRQVSEKPHIELDRVLLQLVPDLQSAQKALEFLARRIRARAAAPSSMAPILAAWDPVIAGLIAAEEGGALALEASAKLDEHLAFQEQYAVPLVAAIRQISAGQRDPVALAQQDITYTAVIRRALDALDGQVTIPRELWKAMPLSILLAMVVAAAAGDKSGVGTRVRHKLEEFRAHPGLVALSRRLERIIDGDRDTRMSHDLDPLDRAIVTTVLTHIRAAEQAAPAQFRSWPPASSPSI